MAVIFVTGPVLHYVSFPNTTTGLFLGTSEFSPRFKIPKFWKPVINDLMGMYVPIEELYQGQVAQIVTEINRYNESTYAQIAAPPRYGQGALANPRGLQGPLDIGAKVVGNACYFTLYLVFPFAGTPNSPAAQGMPGLYRFPICKIKGEDAQQQGTKERKISLLIEAQNYYQPGNTAGATSQYNPTIIPAGGNFLYDNTTGGVTLPAPD